MQVTVLHVKLLDYMQLSAIWLKLNKKHGFHKSSNLWLYYRLLADYRREEGRESIIKVIL